MSRILLEIATVMRLGGGENSVTKYNVFEQNNGALTPADYVNTNPRTKHIGVKYHFSRIIVAKAAESHLLKLTLF